MQRQYNYGRHNSKFMPGALKEEKCYAKSFTKIQSSIFPLIWLILVQIYLLCYAIDNKREKKGTFPQTKIANVDFQINFVNFGPGLVRLFKIRSNLRLRKRPKIIFHLKQQKRPKQFILKMSSSLEPIQLLLELLSVCAYPMRNSETKLKVERFRLTCAEREIRARTLS